MSLIFKNYRHYSALGDMPAFERRQYYAGTTYQKNTQASADEIDEFLLQLFDEGTKVELVDVVGEKGEVLYQWITDIDGGATLHSNGQTDCLAKACQHSIEYCTTKSLWLSLADAQRRFGILKYKTDFSIDEDGEDCFKQVE